MVKEQLYKNDYAGNKMPVDPIVSTIENLDTQTNEPLAASQGYKLDQKKLDKYYEDAHEGQVLTINHLHEAVPEYLSDRLVDLDNNQTIIGEKTFLNITKGMSFLVGEDNKGAWFSFASDTAELCSFQNGQFNGTFTVKASKFWDPFDEDQNPPQGTKDAKIRELINAVAVKSEVFASTQEAPQADVAKSLSINGHFYNLPGGSKIIASQTIFQGGWDLKGLSIDGKTWNIATASPSMNVFQNAPVAQSLILPDANWNLPGAVVNFIQFATPATDMIYGLVASAEKIGHIVIVHVNFSIRANRTGQETILTGLNQPVENVITVGNEEISLTMNYTEMIVIVQKGAAQTRMYGRTFVYVTND